MNAAKQRTIAPYRLLDGWRGIASLAVVMFHASEVIVRKDPAAAGQPLYAASAYGYLGVELFFVISGYCIANAADSALRRSHPARSFVRARLRRIYPPCLISLLLYVIYAMVATRGASIVGADHDAIARYDLSSQTWRFWLANLTLTQLVFNTKFLSIVCWTLCYELAFYAAFAAVIALVARQRGRDAAFWTIHLITLVISGILLIAPRLLPYPWDLWVPFGQGVLVYDLFTRSSNRVLRSTAAVLVLLWIATAVTIPVMLGPMQHPGHLVILTGLLFSMMLVALRRFDARIAAMPPMRALQWVGGFSYSLYLVHFVSINAANQTLRLIFPPTSHPLTRFAYLIICSVIAGWIFYQVGERPFIKNRNSAAAGKEVPVAMIGAPILLPASGLPATPVELAAQTQCSHETRSCHT